MLTLSLLLVKEQKEVKYRSILKHSLMVEITKKKKKGWYVVMWRVAVMLGYVCIGVCVWALLVQDMFVYKHVCVICMDTTSVWLKIRFLMPFNGLLMPSNFPCLKL